MSGPYKEYQRCGNPGITEALRENGSARETQGWQKRLRGGRMKFRSIVLLHASKRPACLHEELPARRLDSLLGKRGA